VIGVSWFSASYSNTVVWPLPAHEVTFSAHVLQAACGGGEHDWVMHVQASFLIGWAGNGRQRKSILGS